MSDLPEIQGDDYLISLTIDGARAAPLEVLQGICQGWLIWSSSDEKAVGTVILSSPDGNPASRYVHLGILSDPRMFSLPEITVDSQGSLRHSMSLATSLSVSEIVTISDPARIEWISRFVIDPQLQGQGVGKKAMKAMYEMADAQNKSLGLQSRALDSVSYPAMSLVVRMIS